MREECRHPSNQRADLPFELLLGILHAGHGSHLLRLADCAKSSFHCPEHGEEIECHSLHKRPAEFMPLCIEQPTRNPRWSASWTREGRDMRSSILTAKTALPPLSLRPLPLIMSRKPSLGFVESRFNVREPKDLVVRILLPQLHKTDD